jgi:hypothetical protein
MQFYFNSKQKEAISAKQPGWRHHKTRRFEISTYVLTLHRSAKQTHFFPDFKRRLPDNTNRHKS